jgi:hypothetical protein
VRMRQSIEKRRSLWLCVARASSHVKLDREMLCENFLK